MWCLEGFRSFNTKEDRGCLTKSGPGISTTHGEMSPILTRQDLLCLSRFLHVCVEVQEYIKWRSRTRNSWCKWKKLFYVFPLSLLYEIKLKISWNFHSTVFATLTQKWEYGGSGKWDPYMVSFYFASANKCSSERALTSTVTISSFGGFTFDGFIGGWLFTYLFFLYLQVSHSMRSLRSLLTMCVVLT